MLVKNGLGHFEKQDALSSRWLIAFEWLDFLPEDNLRDHRLQYMNQDLVMLLRLKHHLFWSQIVYDKSLSSFINSYLMYARRVGTTRGSSLSATDGVFVDPALDMSKLSVSHKSLMRNLFTVILRIATGKESPSIGFGSAAFHGDLVYQVLDLPRLMDFVSIYSRFNLPVVSTVVSHLFDIQPKYSEELGKVITAATQVLQESWRQLSRSLQSTLSTTATTTPAPDAASNPSADSPPVEEDKISSLRETGEDLATYLIDLLYTLSSFAKVRPAVTQQLGESDFVAALSYTLRAALPNLRLVFEGGAPAPIDIIRRHVATRNHALSIINKIITLLVTEIDEVVGHEEEPISPEAIKNRIALIIPSIQVLISHLQSLTTSDRKLVERVAKKDEDARPFAWLLIEDEQQQQSHSNASFKPSGALNTSTGLAHAVVSPEANNIIRALDEKYEVTTMLAEFSDQLAAKWATSAHFGPLKEQLIKLDNLLNEMRSLAEVSSLASSLAMETPAQSRQQELKWQDTVKQASEVRQIATDLSDGFIAYALLQHYGGSSERFINDYIESSLSVDLNGLDRKMSVDAARQKIQQESNLAVEESKRFRVSGDALRASGNLRSSKGTSKYTKRKGKDNLAEYFAQSKANTDAMADLTLRFIAAQEKADDERTYTTQIRRARGDNVDEDAEELYESLKASAEFFERAAERSAAMTYEDEPDDSLDDFHPVGAMADSDRDSSLVGRGGFNRNKFGGNPLLSRAPAPAEDEEDDEDADYAGDYGQATQSDLNRGAPRGSGHQQQGGQQQGQHQDNRSQGRQGGQKQQGGGQQRDGHKKSGNQGGNQGGNQQHHQQQKGGQGGQKPQGGKKSGASAPSSSGMSSAAPAYTPAPAKAAPQPAPQGGGGRGGGAPKNASQPKQSMGRGKPSQRGGAAK